LTAPAAPSVAMRASVILSTYNAPDLLEKVLLSYSAQVDLEPDAFEVVIADDGSGPETVERIAALQPHLSFPVRHVWHEDRGFRKCTILNRAIVESQADYLIFSDGDCIPRPDFLATHLALREPGRFLSGGYFKLSRAVSEALTAEDARSGRATDPAFLRSLGVGRSLKTLRLTAGPRLAPLLDWITPTGATWNGHNASGWRRDILAANGFDERMAYGGEDRELGERLENAGIRGKQIRHRAVCVHLWHERGYIRQADLIRNRAIRDETHDRKRRVTPYGIERSALPPRHKSSPVQGKTA